MRRRPAHVDDYDTRPGGGIAGRTGKLVVQPHGSTGSLTTRSGSERAVKLEAAELEALADDVESADLPGLPEDSSAGRPQPAAFGYRWSTRAPA